MMVDLQWDAFWQIYRSENLHMAKSSVKRTEFFAQKYEENKLCL